MRNILSTLHDLIFVPKCGGCHTRMRNLEDGMCTSCHRLYLDEKDEFCDFCGLSASICTCIPQNMMIGGCIDYRKLIFYRKNPHTAPIHNMFYSVKRSYNLALIDFFADELYKIDKGMLPKDCVVTYAPRLKKSVKKYGYDHGKLLAEKYAKVGEYRFETLIKRKNKYGRSEQKLLNFRQRAANVKDVFSVTDEKAAQGKHIILIDDVVTSGATLGECVSVLYAAGARSVTCRSIAHTYRKNKQKNY
ncbi:MAG: ComF family protein [Clostridia bacterium]|nr:ComF family protein [Clostridia bacterium]